MSPVRLNRPPPCAGISFARPKSNSLTSPIHHEPEKSDSFQPNEDLLLLVLTSHVEADVIGLDIPVNNAERKEP